MSDRTTTSKRVRQLGAMALVLGSLLFLVNKLDEMSLLFLGRWIPDVISGRNSALILLGQASFIIGYVIYYRFYSQRVGRAARNALRLVCAGGIALAIGHITFMSAVQRNLPPPIQPYFEYLFLAVVIGLLVLLVGLIWFGILNLRRPVLLHWRWLPLMTGLTGLIGFVLFGGEEITTAFLVFRTLFALGLAGLGVILWLEEPG